MPFQPTPSAFPHTWFAGMHLAALCRCTAAQVKYMGCLRGLTAHATLPTESYPDLASLSSGTRASGSPRSSSVAPCGAGILPAFMARRTLTRGQDARTTTPRAPLAQAAELLPHHEGREGHEGWNGIQKEGGCTNGSAGGPIFSRQDAKNAKEKRQTQSLSSLISSRCGSCRGTASVCSAHFSAHPNECHEKMRTKVRATNVGLWSLVTPLRGRAYRK